MNIYEKMLAITSEMKPLEKSLNVANKYHAVGEQDVLPMVRALEKKYKVYSFPINQEIVSEDAYLTTSKSGEELHNRFLRVRVTYRFVNIEEPTDYLEIATYGDGLDTADKGPGKAFTYATKTALIKAYKMNSGEDPDFEATPSDEDEAQKVPPKPRNEFSKELHIEKKSEASSPISVVPEGAVDQSTGEVSIWADWASKLEIDLEKVKKAYPDEPFDDKLIEKAVKQKASALTNKTPLDKIDDKVLKMAVYNLKKKTLDAKSNKTAQ